MDFDHEQINALMRLIRNQTEAEVLPPSRIIHAFRLLAGPAPDVVVAEYIDASYQDPMCRWTVLGLSNGWLSVVTGSVQANRGWTWNAERLNRDTFAGAEISAWKVRADDVVIRILGTISWNSDSDPYDRHPASLESATAQWRIETRGGDAVTFPRALEYGSTDAMEQLVQRLQGGRDAWLPAS